MGKQLNQIITVKEKYERALIENAERCKTGNITPETYSELKGVLKAIVSDLDNISREIACEEIRGYMWEGVNK